MAPKIDSLLKLRNLALAVIVRAAGSAGNFVFLLLSARLFGVDSAGLVFNTLAVGYTSCILANMGLSRLTLRNLPRLADQGIDIGPVTTRILTLIKTTALGLAGIGAIGMGGVLWMPSTGAQDWIWLQGTFLGLMLGAGLLVLLGLADVLKTHGRVGTAILVEVSAFPWLSVLGLILVYSVGLTETDLTPALICVFAALALACVAIWWLPDLARGAFYARAPGDLRRAAGLLSAHSTELWTYWVSGSLVMMTSRISALAAPFFLLPAEAGFMAALVGIASLGGTIIAAAQAYFAPRFSRLHAADQRRILGKELVLSQAVVGGLFACIAVPAILFPGPVLSLFGPELAAFPAGMLLLAVAAQQLRCTTGCSEIFLSMTSKANLELISLLTALAVFWAVVLLGSGPILPTFVTAYSAMLVSRAALSYAAAVFVLRAMPDSEKASPK